MFHDAQHPSGELGATLLHSQGGHFGGGSNSGPHIAAAFETDENGLTAALPTELSYGGDDRDAARREMRERLRGVGVERLMHLPLANARRQVDFIPDGEVEAEGGSGSSDRPALTPFDLESFCTAFDMGSAPLGKWRTAVARFNKQQQHQPRNNGNDGNLDGKASAALPPVQGSPSPPVAAQRLLDHCRRQLDLVVSPFLELRSDAADGGVTFVARRPIPAGAFLLSIPSDALLMATPLDELLQAAGQTDQDLDDVARFFIPVEDLSARLLHALTDSNSPWHAYAQYLFRFAPVPRNLPFILPPTAIDTPAEDSTVTDASSEREITSATAIGLLRAYHETVLPSPLCPALRGVSPKLLRWAAAMVLSRRIGSSVLPPCVDMLNHAHKGANAYYTMCTPSTMTLLDFFDNVLAGVADKNLCEPHLHVCALSPIAQGAPVTLSYSDVDPVAVDELDSSPGSNARRTAKRSGVLGSSSAPAVAVAGGRASGLAADVDMDRSASVSEVGAGGEKMAAPAGGPVAVERGADVWRLLWGFVPPVKTDTTAGATAQVAEIIARKRVLDRRSLFPPPGAAAHQRANA
jgi:hypothetical protein